MSPRRCTSGSRTTASPRRRLLKFAGATRDGRQRGRAASCTLLLRRLLRGRWLALRGRERARAGIFRWACLTSLCYISEVFLGNARGFVGGSLQSNAVAPLHNSHREPKYGCGPPAVGGSLGGRRAGRRGRQHSLPDWPGRQQSGPDAARIAAPDQREFAAGERQLQGGDGRTGRPDLFTARRPHATRQPGRTGSGRQAGARKITCGHSFPRRRWWHGHG